MVRFLCESLLYEVVPGNVEDARRACLMVLSNQNNKEKSNYQAYFIVPLVASLDEPAPTCRRPFANHQAMDIALLLNFDGPVASYVSSLTPTGDIGEDTASSDSDSDSDPLESDSVARGVVQYLQHTREISQKHRDRKRTAVDKLWETVDELRSENDTLVEFTRVLRARSATDGDTSSDKLSAMMRNSAAQAHPYLHRVSDLTAARYGLRYLTGAMALVMMETVAYRRNAVKVRCETDSGRRCRTELKVAPRSVFEAVMQRGVTALRASLERVQMGSHHDSWVQTALEELANLHQVWSHEEWVLYHAPLTSPISLQTLKKRDPAASAVRPTKTIKKCLRCGELRAAGLGHKRSTCRDGYHVKSNVPYSFFGSVKVGLKTTTV